MNRVEKPDIMWLDDPAVFGVNMQKAHSDHTIYRNEDEVLKGQSSLVKSLSGQWNFVYSKNAKERPADFYKWSIADIEQKTDKIKVPSHIEFSGYDRFHYINTMYPWEGHIFRRPLDSDKKAHLTGSFANALYNPVGSYITVFDRIENTGGYDQRIRFEGVEQAYYVWLNGEFIGYSEDSFTSHEFDITDYIKESDNILAVEVHKRSTAAFLEDQDFFRFFGIFRDVKLIATPKSHVEDLEIRSTLNEDNISGCLSVDIKLNKSCPGSKIKLKLLSPEGKEVICDEHTVSDEEGFVFGADGEKKGYSLSNIKPWAFKSPVLYNLKIEAYDKDGTLCEVIPYKTGFRRIEIKDKIILYNGERLRICGVNRHEWNPESGRSITVDDMKKDMELFKKNNINAVRTCHYPDRIEWYHMCDEEGIYMMAETNMETHGSWMKLGALDPSWNVPGDDPVWKEAVLDRANSNYEWFKNHTSVLFWSLGNESFVGEDIREMNDFFKSKNDGRLTHYEGLWVRRAEYEDKISDVESTMYAKPEDIDNYFKNGAKKPYILCEYMHCMGNSLGGFNSYMKLFDKYEGFHGGFIWDFIDQAIYVEDEVTGQKVLRYGGDFDDRPADYEFSQNGICFADRTEKPGIQEVRYYYGKYNS
ncbi:MAG: beta-galactosidase [Lachnospiraceae bacterium]|nr:beta-galactosidase [Lachnospiraceae bacterium]